jgi:hypothetical protein
MKSHMRGRELRRGILTRGCLAFLGSPSLLILGQFEDPLLRAYGDEPPVFRLAPKQPKRRHACVQNQQLWTNGRCRASVAYRFPVALRQMDSADRSFRRVAKNRYYKTIL